MARKSYWQEAYVGGEKSQDAIKSWFGSMAEGMTVYKAEILTTIVDDREKKMRAFMTDKDDRHYQFERTLGGKTFSVTRKLLPARAALASAQDSKG